MRHHFYQKTGFIYLLAALASIALSIWIPYREVLINPDGICYLISAQEMGIGGLKSAMHICPQAKWPFYSALIYAFTSLTHLPLVFSAYFINGVFALISVLMFIAVISELGGSRRVLWLAACVILLAHDFNAVRQYIVRDHGYWAFYLTSLFLLLRYFREPSWLMALLWSGSMMLATCFRIEGAAFLALTPFAALFCSRYTVTQRLRAFLQLNTLSLLVVLMLGSWLLAHPQQSLDQLGRLPELMAQAKNGLAGVTSRWQRSHDGLLQSVLDKDSASQVNLLLTLMVFFGYLVSLFSSLSVVYALLIVFTWISRAALWTRASTLVVLSYLLINLLVTTVFYAQHLFLSKRYLVAISLILMLWVPYALDKLLRKSHRQYYKQAFAVALVWICAVSLGGIFEFGYSKSYIHQAGNWLEANVPPNATLYANSYQLLYYSRHFGTEVFNKSDAYHDVEAIAGDKWKKFDYLALLLKSDKDEKVAQSLQQAGLKPIKTFSNKRGDQVAIYHVLHDGRAV